MSILRHVFYYEWLSFVRNRFQVAILFLTLALGIYAIYYGYDEMSKQRTTIATVQNEHRQEQARILKGFNADTTTTDGKKEYQLSAVTRMVWSRQFYGVFFSPSALAPLSIGQRDIQPYYYKLKAMSLYYQLFQNEIANPQKLLVGNFDLSFVLVYLFPLLIISLSYGLLSSEKDRGLLALLKSQTAPVHIIVIYKLLFYFLVIFSLALVLSTIGFIIADVGLIANCSEITSWLAIVTVYFLFWFSVMFFIVSLNKNSSFNAISGIGSWLMFLIIIPAVLNIAISIAMPLNSSVLSGISRRTGVFNEESDENQKRVIRQYLKQKPELDFGEKMYQTNLVTKGFAAYTELNDQKSAKLVQLYHSQVQEREEIARRFDFINPAVNAQAMFNAVADTDLESFQNFYRSVKAYHQRLVSFYYPKLFADKNLTVKDYKLAPQFKSLAHARSKTPLLFGLMWLLGLSLMICVVSFKIIKTSI